MNETQPMWHTTQQDTNSGKWLRRAFLLAIVLGCAVAMSPNRADPDLWGHVRYGEDVLADRAIAETTTYSFTAEGYRWINHENLAEIVLAVGANTVGPIGMVVAKCVLGVLLILLVVRHTHKQGVGLMTVGIVALLVAMNMSYHWSLRPQVLSYTYFALLIGLLSYCFHGWQNEWHLPQFGRRGEADERPTLAYSSERMRLLWLAPIIFLFWTNSHGGFVAGFCIYTAYLVCRSIEALVRRGRSGFGIVRRFALMVVVAGLATFVNPYGPGLHFWLALDLAPPRPEITEWLPPQLFAVESYALWLMIGLFSVSIVFTRRVRDFTHLVILLITMWQSVEHIRHGAFLAILFGFWMPIHVESLLKRVGIGRNGDMFNDQVSPAMRRLLTGGLIVAFALLIGKLTWRLSDLRVERAYYPVSAMQYVADHDLKGRMVVTFNWAQYVIGVFGPRSPEEEGIRVAFDGRYRTCYPQEICDMHFDFILGNVGPEKRWRSPQSPPFDDSRVLKFKNPDLVLIDRRQLNSVEVMLANRDQWVLMYQDTLAQLWGRRSKYDDPQSPDYISPDDRVCRYGRQYGSVTWPAQPVPRTTDKQLAAISLGVK